MSGWSLSQFTSAHIRSPMATNNYYSSRSPPPLQHPVPTHPAFIPEPPSTPASPQGYQRYASSPQAPQPHPPQHFPHPTAYPQFSHQPPHLAPIQNQGVPPVPDFSAWGIDGATAQFGMQLGQNAVAAGQSYVQRNVRSFFSLFTLNNFILISFLLAWRSHTRHSSETSFQCLKFLRHPQITPRCVSLEA